MSAMLADTRPGEATAFVETPRPERKRVVIIGGGFAGLAAARALRNADAEVGSRTIEELEADRDKILLGLIELRTKRPETAAPRKVAARAG